MAIPSKYPGKCTVCCENYDEGESIVRDPDDNGWCHEGCGDDDE